MSISVIVCVYLWMYASRRAFVESLHSGAVRTFCLYKVRYTLSEWKLFSVILEIKFSSNTCSLMYREIRCRLGRSPIHPSAEQWLRCMHECVCTARRHLNCVRRGKRILSNLTLFNASTVRMHLALCTATAATTSAVVVCTVNSRLLLKIAHFLSMRLWIFFLFCSSCHFE